MRNWPKIREANGSGVRATFVGRGRRLSATSSTHHTRGLSIESRRATHATKCHWMRAPPSCTYGLILRRNVDSSLMSGMGMARRGRGSIWRECAERCSIATSEQSISEQRQVGRWCKGSKVEAWEKRSDGLACASTHIPYVMQDDSSARFQNEYRCVQEDSQHAL
jgi:hypothetical protein